MPKRLLALALASAAAFSACGGGGSSNAVSISSISKCAHARPQTISASTPTLRMVVAKTTKGGWLFQSAADETEADEQAHAPGFDVYVFPDPKSAQEAFSLIAHSENAQEEFGGGGTFIAKNVVIDTDQTPPGSLDSFADALLKKCVGSSATQSLHREEDSTGDSTEGTASETPAAPETGEVGAPSEAEPSAGQSPYPGERR
jgi:hypothetical protein